VTAHIPNSALQSPLLPARPRLPFFSTLRARRLQALLPTLTLMMLSLGVAARDRAHLPQPTFCRWLRCRWPTLAGFPRTVFSTMPNRAPTRLQDGGRIALVWLSETVARNHSWRL